ncbi:MAG: hypothetical protein NT027_11095 [Proteobacteria bacterium]|nr:hypothetical protein [Pseudomonadota bacterium]
MNRLFRVKWLAIAISAAMPLCLIAQESASNSGVAETPIEQDQVVDLSTTADSEDMSKKATTEPQSTQGSTATKPAAGPIAQASASSVMASDSGKKTDLVVNKGSSFVPFPADAEVSDGSQLSLEGKGFKITPPIGWMVNRAIPRMSLFLQGPTKSEIEYPRNINVVRFPGPKVIDNVSGESFAQYLTINFPKSSPDIANYSVRNFQMTQLQDGRDVILYYTDYESNGKAMMQAHILASSETAHYLISYTDIAAHFDTDDSSSTYLPEAWGSMISVQLDSPNPQPMKSAGWLIGGLIGLGVLGIVFSLWKRKKTSSEYAKYAESDEVMEASSAAANLSETTHLSNASASSDDEVFDSRETPLSSASILDFEVEKRKLQKPTKISKKESMTLDQASKLPAKLENGDEDELKDSVADESFPPDQWKVS